MSQALPYVDILFGNDEEAQAFAKAAGYETTEVHEIALKMAAIEKVAGPLPSFLQANKERPRIVIFTQAGDPIIVAEGGRIREIPVEKLPPEQIVDTNGAGDAFCGGLDFHL